MRRVQTVSPVCFPENNSRSSSKQLIMDKMKESSGLERQRNLIIKRYVKGRGCLTVSCFNATDGGRSVSETALEGS